MCTTQSEDRQLPLRYTLYTRCHCEQLVRDRLEAKGFHVFLPKIDAWSRRAGLKHLISVPTFPGYLFLRHALDKSSSIKVHKSRGLVRIMGESWDKPSIVPNGDIEAIQAILRASVPVMPHPYLHEGQRAPITQGSLRGVEGILLQSNTAKGKSV